MAEVAQTAAEVNDAEDFMEKAIKVQMECIEFVERIPKISKENLRKHKELMTKFMGVVSRQRIVIAMLLGKTHEQKEILDKKFEALESPRVSYAEKAGFHRSRSGKIEQGAVALIYPKTECEKGLVKNKLQSVIDPAKIKVGIRSVRNLNKGGVVIECGSEQKIQRLKEEIEKNEVTKDEMELKRPKKFNPKLLSTTWKTI
ncbi:hypothetical protein AVEN_172837-1 [Araneus ventricosus]|uniref:Uncharacterized protein n=1 Tax=Araneus ventricosus TaxID=182803 RepID=A0A4Y2S9W5_ARAVE|nr:hypothetical protein AVEN_172837-1 [Araneus ventricosus]